MTTRLGSTRFHRDWLASHTKNRFSTAISRVRAKIESELRHAPFDARVTPIFFLFPQCRMLAFLASSTLSSSSSPKPSFLTWSCHPTTSWRTIQRLAPTTWRAWRSLPIPVWPACTTYLRDTDGRVRIGPSLPLCVMIRGGNGRLHVHLMSLLQDRSRSDHPYHILTQSNRINISR